MKIAVIGAGFAGLGLCSHLLAKGIQVDLYDQKGVGAGASGVASGLVHPYAGEGVKRSWKACEALEEARALLILAQQFSSKKVADFSGIIRKPVLNQQEALLQAGQEFGDVELLSDGSFWIKSGITVHSQAYLEGLYQACLFKGLQMKIQKIHSMDELSGYDYSFFAVGAGVFFFPEMAFCQLRPVKGQALVCRFPKEKPALTKSLLAKGYVVPLEDGLVYLGSTYERGVFDDTPCLDKALLDLTPKAADLIPGWNKIDVIECRAGVRVAKLGSYFPLIEKISNNVWALTAMGSRGLLYHGYAAKMLVEQALP